jgi:hypothetical protein
LFLSGFSASASSLVCPRKRGLIVNDSRGYWEVTTGWKKARIVTPRPAIREAVPLTNPWIISSGVLR